MNVESHCSQDKFNEILTSLGFLNDNAQLISLSNEIWSNLSRHTDIET